MITKPNITMPLIILGMICLFFACDDSRPAKKQAVPNVISKKISQPVAESKKSELKEVKKEKVISDQAQVPVAEVAPTLSLQNKNAVEDEHYNAKGKIDPFKPLIQEKTQETTAVVDNRPKRILTPLEKIELSQIRLVAVIIMKNRQLAMVEDAAGKGYEVKLGTYIGKNQGRVSKIKESSLEIKELVKDFKGQLKERIQEIKLHKNDSEE